jgi:hypothetical protein
MKFFATVAASAVAAAPLASATAPVDAFSPLLLAACGTCQAPQGDVGAIARAAITATADPARHDGVCLFWLRTLSLSDFFPPLPLFVA